MHERLTRSVWHIGFCVAIMKRQLEAGRKFMFEHPAGATSWELKLLSALDAMPGVQRVSFDFCELGTMSSDEMGEALARKPTSVLTNCPGIAGMLARAHCKRDHRHVQLTNGRAKACQIYPRVFCEEVCRAFTWQLRK